MRPQTMGLGNFAFWLGSVAVAGLFATAATAQTAQPAPKSGTTPCFNLGCPIVPVPEAAPESETRAPGKPYDWKASFAQYKVGKVPRTADGKPERRKDRRDQHQSAGITRD